MTSAIEASNLRAEVAQSQARDASLGEEISELSNAMGDAQHALFRIEGYAMHLATGQGRIEENTTYLPTALSKTENNTIVMLNALSQAENNTARLGNRIEAIESTIQGNLNLLGNINNTSERLSSFTTERLSSVIDKLEFLIVRDESIRLALDAIRIDQRHAMESATRDAERLEAKLELADRTWRLEFENMSALIDEKISHLSQKDDGLLSLAGVQVSRLDFLAQRAALPLGSEVLMRMPDGLLLVPADDTALVTAIWESGGRLEKGTVDVAVALLEEGDSVLDVGANVGLLTIPLARRVGPAGHVIAVEASSRVADLLRRSVFLNFGSGRVVVYHCAAGSEPGAATLNIGQTAGHSSLLALPSSDGTEQVEVKKLDDLIQSGTRFRLVKIDVEGFEPEVWRGMTRIVSENPELAVIVEFGMEHLRRAHIGTGAWLDLFISSGFSAYEIDETTGTIAPLRMQHDLEKVVSINLLFLRLPVSAYPRLKLR